MLLCISTGVAGTFMYSTDAFTCIALAQVVQKVLVNCEWSNLFRQMCFSFIIYGDVISVLMCVLI